MDNITVLLTCPGCGRPTTGPIKGEEVVTAESMGKLVPAMLTEEELEALYIEWADSDAHAYESNHYGHERAAFYAGVTALLLSGQ